MKSAGLVRVSQLRVLLQMVQLHFTVGLERSRMAVYLIAPQWQLPWWVSGDIGVDWRDVRSGRKVLLV